MISVLIPTYNQPEALDLCLQSLILGQDELNEVIVIENGYCEQNQQVFEKWKKHINVLPFEENVGMSRALNMGVYNATCNNILITHDDMVFPKKWDYKLSTFTKYKNAVITLNSIEPTPSMFKQFNIKDLGRNPSSFNLQKFWEYEENICLDKIDESGSTFPFMMNKYDYLRIGGFDDNYPGPWVVDWEFFLKCKMSNMKMIRTYNCYLYHFVSLSTRTPEKIIENKTIEQQCHNFAYYKWGSFIFHNPENNDKFINIYNK